MTALFLVGDVRDRMAELDDGSFDFVLCSPPFLALRSYLPPDHPDKAKEIGSEATPAEFIDVLLELTAEWGRLLAPHGSLAIELGDTYAGSGGAGGDYDPDGLRDGQPRFRQQPPNKSERFNADGSVRTSAAARAIETKNRPETLPMNGGRGWPLDKSLACIPQLYQVALAYGINPLTGAQSPAGRWRVRNLKPWIRSNPPVGALGDKERPATSYVVVATRARDRWFDLDAVRTRPTQDPATYTGNGYTKGRPQGIDGNESMPGNAAGAPPRDWWHHVDAVLDAELTARAGKYNGGTGERNGKETHAGRGGGWSTFDKGGDHDDRNVSIGAQGVHLRRALERAGILRTVDALDVSPKGYSGAHYAVWPPELVRLLVDEMCPRRVCTQCGEPSRRIVGEAEYVPSPGSYWGIPGGGSTLAESERVAERVHQWKGPGGSRASLTRSAPTLGWSDCGCESCTYEGHDHRGGAGRCAFCDCNLNDHWRPGRILDPFVGSGTTLAVATGMGRDATGIDIDERNADLASDRVGMFLTVDHPTREASA